MFRPHEVDDPQDLGRPGAGLAAGAGPQEDAQDHESRYNRNLQEAKSHLCLCSVSFLGIIMGQGRFFVKAVLKLAGMVCTWRALL